VTSQEAQLIHEFEDAGMHTEAHALYVATEDTRDEVLRPAWVDANDYFPYEPFDGDCGCPVREFNIRHDDDCEYGV